MRLILLLIFVLLGSTAAVAEPLSVCPFKSSELQTVLGIKFDEGRPGMAFGTPGIDARSCKYESKNWSLRVGTQIYKQPEDAKKFAMGLAGKLVPIVGDADGAVYQEGQGDNTSPTVWYARQGVVVELRGMGIWYAESSNRQTSMEALRVKLAKLRRIP